MNEISKLVVQVGNPWDCCFPSKIRALRMHGLIVMRSTLIPMLIVQHRYALESLIFSTFSVLARGGRLEEFANAADGLLGSKF